MEFSKSDQKHGFVCFKDEELFQSEEYRGMIKARRVDNDIDSDEEQMEAGVGYLYSELIQRFHQ